MRLWGLIVLLFSCLITEGCYRPSSGRSTNHVANVSFRYPNTPQAAMLAFISALDRRDAKAASQLLPPYYKAANNIMQMRQLMSIPEYETRSKVVAVVFHGHDWADVECQSNIVRRVAPIVRGSFRFVGRVVRVSSDRWAVDAIDVQVPTTEFPERRAWNHEHLRPLAQAIKAIRKHK